MHTKIHVYCRMPFIKVQDWAELAHAVRIPAGSCLREEAWKRDGRGAGRLWVLVRVYILSCVLVTEECLECLCAKSLSRVLS